MLQTRRIHEVNIEGTRIILDVCLEFKIKRLVYVSTYNVVFGGKEIVNGDENLPYIPPHQHISPYARSKAFAERLVLSYNAKPFRENGGCLYTCAVRPAAVYGAGEVKTFPWIINYAKLRLLLFKVGDSSVKTDWIYVDNLVHGLLLASMGLLHEFPDKENHPIAAGNSYFISDGFPVNTFEFIQPLLDSLEYGQPGASLTVPCAFAFGKICWVFYTILYPFLNVSWLPQPLILPADVYQVGVTHYFCQKKAREELGYVPRVSPQEGMSIMISYWRHQKKNSLDCPSIYPWIFCVCGLSGLFAINFLPNVGPITLLNDIALFIFRSTRNIQIFSSIVAVAHTSEATFAWFLAKKVDRTNAKGWFWQTLLLATFSLRLLLKRAGPKTEQNTEKLLSN
ncbi:uncharacterized protein LOC130798119 isoform X2 [Amaranthus tricolor]|nr:uncharacterized protein LOC130798119 isoform X2 [Amaranthus tricolor]